MNRNENFIKTCELNKCGKEFSATRVFYKDGMKVKWETRFCSKKCARSFASSCIKKYVCEKCRKSFKKSQSYNAHLSHCGKNRIDGNENTKRKINFRG